MKIGILGAGTMGTALARRLARAGHDVVTGVRNPDAGGRHAELRLASLQDAARHGEIVVVALPWPANIEVLPTLPLAAGAVLVDVSNPESADGRGLEIGHTTSGSEVIARTVPSLHVVKAFSHYYAELLDEDHAFDGGTPSVLYCGDDADAKTRVRTMIESIGLDPVDAGALDMARYLEPFAMLTVALVRTQGWGPTGVAWRMMRRV